VSGFQTSDEVVKSGRLMNYNYCILDGDLLEKLERKGKKAVLGLQADGTPTSQMLTRTPGKG
jgi:hypothetical protein